MARTSRRGDRTVRGSAGTAAAAGAITGAGSTPAFDTEDASTVVGTVNVTAVSGTTPSLTVNLQTSFDGGSTWVTVGSFAAKTAAASETKAFTGIGDLCRFQWAAPSGTTPSLTTAITYYAK